MPYWSRVLALLTWLTVISVGVAPDSTSEGIKSVTQTPPGNSQSVIVENKGSVLVLPNSTVEFTCTCTRECQSPIWNYNNVSNASNRIKTKTGSPAVLLVTNLQRVDLEHISCVDSGVSAKPSSSVVVFPGELWLLVNVTSPSSELKSRNDKWDVSVGVNGPINLTCIVQPPEASRLQVNMSWSWESKSTYPNVLEGQKPVFDRMQPYTVSSTTATAHTLVFEAIERKYRGEYSCAATIAGVGRLQFRDKSPSKVFIRVKDRLSALWPFLGIVAEVLILTTIILIYERRRAAREADAAAAEEEEEKPIAGAADAAPGAPDAQEVRQRSANA